MSGANALKAKWLEHYQRSLNITRACLDTGISRRAYYNWVDGNPKFRETAVQLKDRDWGALINKIIITRKTI